MKAKPLTLLYICNGAISHSYLHQRAFRALRKKQKLISAGGDSGSKKSKQGYGSVYGGAIYAHLTTT